MKRIIIVLLILIVVLLIAFGIYFFVINKIPIEPSGDEIASGEVLAESEKVTVQTVLTQTETQRRQIYLEMPAFTDLSDYSFQETINKKISDSINPYINEISIVSDESVPVTVKYKYKVSFERYNNDNYVSLVVSQNYSTGGMRSNVWKDTYNVDVKANKELKLADVCASPVYKQKIVDEVNKQAASKDIKIIAGNGLADIPDTQRFYIKDKKLYIYFEPASIAPYLDGELHFEMPFEYANGKFIMN